MDKIPRLSSEQRQNLVAYLDGELSATETRAIEETLARSDVARHEVEMLARTWDLFGSLPLVRASESFAGRTMATIRMAEERLPWTQRPWYRHARRGAVLAGWVAALSVAAVIGFMATDRWLPDGNAALLENYPVIKDLDTYVEVGNVDFLSRLETSGLLTDDAH
jgi:anti-sigma factor RsiW